MDGMFSWGDGGKAAADAKARAAATPAPAATESPAGGIKSSRGEQALGAALASLGRSMGEEPDIPELRLETPAYSHYEDPGRLLSDKRTKRPAATGVKRALSRGLARQNPIDTNGADMLRIQQLTREIQRLEAAVAKARRRRKA